MYDQKPELALLTDMNIVWTKRNLQEFGKSKFHTWRNLYQQEIDPIKKANWEKTEPSTKRAQRCTHVSSKTLCILTSHSHIAQNAEDLQKGAAAYKELYGANPTPFFDPTYMTEEVSGIDMDDEEKRQDQKQYGLTNEGVRGWSLTHKSNESNLAARILMHLKLLFTNAWSMRPGTLNMLKER